MTDTSPSSHIASCNVAQASETPLNPLQPITVTYNICSRTGLHQLTEVLNPPDLPTLLQWVSETAFRLRGRVDCLVGGPVPWPLSFYKGKRVHPPAGIRVKQQEPG